MNLVISTQSLTRSFGPLAAVTGLDLAVRQGEMFGLVGPDGAGKSTALRLLCGILKPSGGAATILGYDLFRAPEQIKRRIGYLSQSFTLYGDLTVDENIEFFAELHGVRNFHPRRDELLDFTRLTSFRGRLAQNLSGGMQKKLALAGTLIHTPELIFLDEPSTGVDPISRGEFWSILSQILDQGVTILLTTPYLDEAERCHGIGLMHRGRLLQTGAPEEIKAALPGRVFRIACAAPRTAYRALRGRWSATRLVLYGDHLNFWTSAGEKEAGDLTAWLDRQGLGPATFQETRPSLEDAFVGLVGNEFVAGASHEN